MILGKVYGHTLFAIGKLVLLKYNTKYWKCIPEA